MNREHLHEQLDAYVDESCTPEELAAIEEHLRTCTRCATAALARLQLKRATRATAAARFAPSPEFRLRIEKTVLKNRRPLWKSLLIPGFAAAVALVLIAVLATTFTRHQASEAALTELLDMHVATLASANPVDVVSTDRHTVKPWFQGKLPFSFNLPELQNSPYQLLGGKLVYLNHAPAAQLLFEVRKHQISVFIQQERAGPLPAAVTESGENGFSVETWDQAGLRYVVVSDTSPGDVHALGDLLRAAGH